MITQTHTHTCFNHNKSQSVKSPLMIQCFVYTTYKWLKAVRRERIAERGSFHCPCRVLCSSFALRGAVSLSLHQLKPPDCTNFHDDLIAKEWKQNRFSCFEQMVEAESEVGFCFYLFLIQNRMKIETTEWSEVELVRKLSRLCGTFKEWDSQWNNGNQFDSLPFSLRVNIFS